jgi:plastocyanin
MRNLYRNIIFGLMLAIMIFVITACSSSTKEDQPVASNTQQSETNQSPSDSVAPSNDSVSAPASESASPTTTPESASPAMASASPSPSADAEETHQHEPSTEPSPSPSKSKPSPEPSPSPSESKSSPEPSAEDRSDKAIVVEIKDFAFSPDKVTIRKGSTVTFINRDKVKHTATADGGEFDTGLLGTDVSGEVKFDETGTFTFYCSPHPGMTGTIVVQDK